MNVKCKRICSCFCAAIGAYEMYRCRTSRYYADFVISCCHGERAIYIHSAVVGFSPEVYYNDTACSPQFYVNPPTQNATCTRTTNHSDIMKCNGKSYCSIPQGVLNYPPYDKLCDEQQNGNFIKITYECLNSGKRKRWFV